MSRAEKGLSKAEHVDVEILRANLDTRLNYESTFSNKRSVNHLWRP